MRIDKKFPRVNFIGNKEKLAGWICDSLPETVNSVFDAFSGGASVSYEAKLRGLKVISNDVLKVNYLLAKALIENKSHILTKEDIETIFKGDPKKGFMYENYSKVLFFPEECMELDLYRLNIERLSSPYKKALAISLMRRAMIRKMPYSRFDLPWDKIKQLRDEEYSYEKYKRRRAYHNTSFKDHFLSNLNAYQESIFDNGQNNKALNADVFTLLKKVKADAIYLDPPYSSTMNNYFGFYGPIDEYIDSEHKIPFDNNFIDKRLSLKLFDRLFSSLSDYKFWFLSYNNSSFPSKEELVKLIERYSTTIKVIEKPHVYKTTGKVNKTKNIEYLFIIEN
jgi:adenine-specific DNA-methyltransferase